MFVTSSHPLFSDGGSGQRWDRRTGEPRWNPEAALPLPQGRALATVPLLSGEWAASARAAGPAALVTERKGEGGFGCGGLEEAGGITGLYCDLGAPALPSEILSGAGLGDRRLSEVCRGSAAGLLLQGKVFPKLRKRSPQGSSESTSSDKEDDEATDYVFRIIYPGTQSEFGKQPWALSSPAPPGNHSRSYPWEAAGLGSGAGKGHQET